MDFLFAIDQKNPLPSPGRDAKRTRLKIYSIVYEFKTFLKILNTHLKIVSIQLLILFIHCVFTNALKFV